LRIPIGGLEEEDKDCSAAENGMKCEAFDESVERPCPPLRELGAESVASHVCHVILLRKGGNRAGGILAVERLTEEYKVCEASANRKVGLLERFEVCLEVG
jgi:hypothetical protein